MGFDSPKMPQFDTPATSLSVEGSPTPQPKLHSLVYDAGRTLNLGDESAPKPDTPFRADLHDAQREMLVQEATVETSPTYTERGSLSEKNIESLVEKLERVRTTDNSPNARATRISHTNVSTPADETHLQHSANDAHRDSCPCGQYMATAQAAEAAPVNQSHSRQFQQPSNAMAFSTDATGSMFVKGTITAAPDLPTTLESASAAGLAQSAFPSLLQNCNVTFGGPVVINMYQGPAQAPAQQPRPTADPLLPRCDYGTFGGAMTCSDGQPVTSRSVSRASSVPDSNRKPAVLAKKVRGAANMESSSLGRSAASIDKAMGKIATDHGFIRKVVVRSYRQQWLDLDMLFDTGSDINVIPMLFVKRLGRVDQIDRGRSIICEAFNGETIAVVGSLKLEWAEKRHNKSREDVFWVVPEENKTVAELVLGREAIRKWDVLKVRVMGTRRKYIANLRPEERVRQNNKKAELDRSVQQNEEDKFARMLEFGLVQPAKQAHVVRR